MTANDVANDIYQLQQMWLNEAAPENRDPRVPPIVERLQQAAGPQAAVTVIGSRARGTDRPDSDLNVMVNFHADPDETTDLAARLNQWLLFLHQAPDLIDSLERQYQIVIDGMLIESQDSLTDFNIVAMNDGQTRRKVHTDLDCGHPGQNRCGDCHACGEHRELGAWHTTDGFLAICRDCWEAVEQLSQRGRQGGRCTRAPLQDQDGNRIEQLRAHNQTCLDCYELQPRRAALLELTAQERNVPGPRRILGATGYYWLRYNL